MACKKITKTNNSNSKLIETLEKIFENEYKAEAAYSYFESDNFINEFGNYIEGYSKADKSFNGRVDDNGEPMLFYDDTAQKYFFVDKDKNNVFYPFVKRGLRSVFNYKQTDKIVSRLALNYFNKSGLNFLNFDTIEFEERQSLPNLKEFIKTEIENKIKELEEKGGKFKLQALVLKKSLLYLNEYVEKVDSFYKKISLKRSDIEDSTSLKVENEETKDPSFSKSSFEQDSKKAISTNVKLKLSLLENNEDLDPIWNEPTFKDFDDVHSTLIHNITNLVALEGEDLFELQKAEIERVAIKKPYLKQLLGFLNDKKFSENDKNQFAQAFNLHGNNFLVSEVRTKFKDRDSGDVIKGYTHSVMEVSESGSKAAIVTSEWGNNFKNKFLDDTNKFKESSKEVLTQIQEELKKLKESINPNGNSVDFKNNINDFVTITRKLGVELTENGIVNFLDNNGALSFDTASQIDNLSKATTQLEIGVKKALKSFIKTKSDFKNPFNEEGVFKKLAKAESFFMSEGSDASIWSSGKNKWLFSYPSYLSTRIKQWQKDPELLKNWFNSSAYNQGSSIMEYLLAEDLDQNMIYEEGEKERIINERLEHLKLGIFNTFQEKNEDFSDVSELSFKDYFNDAINKTLSQSFNRTTTPADKGTDYQIRTGFFIDAYSNTNGNREVNFTEQTETVFFKYFNSEVNRMKEAHKEVDSFKNSPEKLTVNYHFKEGSSVDSKNGNAFKSQYFPELSYDSTSSNEKVNIIKDALYLKKDGEYTNEIKHTADLKSNKELTNLIKEYISDNLREGVNNTISNFLKQEVFVLDNNGELENKGIDNNVYNAYYENNLLNKEETLKAIATDFYINSLINNIEYSKLFTGDVAFYKDMVDYKKRVPATYTDGLQLRIKKGEEFFNIAVTSKVKITPTEYSKIEEILGKEGAKAYQDTNSADGQAWITPARWKFLMERLGKWSDVHDSVYKKMNSDNPEPYTKEELKISAQPVKGVYFYMNGKTPTFLKYSQAVLTKNLVKGTGLQTIYDQMQAQEVDELITLDGIKVGSSTPTTIHNADGTVKDKFTFNVSQLSNYGWKLQQDLPTKTTKETDIGSQIQKNIFAGLLFNKELSGFELDDNITNGQTIINNIVDVVEGLIGVGLSEIKDEFKVFRNGEIKNIKGFYNALVRELEKRGGSQNIIDALNKQTALYGIPQSMDKITNIFSSVMNDHLIKIKTNGGSFVQMSNFGINKNEAVEQGVIMHPDLKNGTTTYEPHYYKDENGKTKVKPGGVFISGSFIAKYIPNYKKYDNVELFVGKDGKPPIIDEKIRKNLIGYRIPNQGLSSNDALEIIGILPEENGDTIVAFTGITTKTGSDFDIDKMYIMMANYTLEEDRLVYTSYDNSIPNKKQSKEALQNRLIELYKSVLTHPKVLKDVMKPLDNDLLKDDIIDLIPNNTDGVMFHFDAYTDIVLRYEYTVGKAGVGQESNALVDINRIGELSINNYFIGWGTKNSKGDTKFDEEYSEELSEEDIDYYVKELIKPGSSPERIKAFREEIRKVKISDSLTAILNAFVDIAKDPYISRGNWTTSTTNTGNLMLRAGVHPLYVTAFMAQPIIKNYIQYQSSLESILNNNSGDTKVKFKRNLVIENLEKQEQNYSELNKPLSLIYQKLVKSDNTNNLTASNATEKLQKVLGSEKLSDDKLEEILTVLKEAHSNIFNEQKIKITDRSQYNLKVLRDQVKSKSDGSIQIAILDKFFELQELSKTLKENVDVSKLDTNGMGKNVNTLFSFFNMRQHIKNKEQSGKDKVLNGFESKFVNSPLEKYYKALEEVMRIVQSNPLLFPQGQKDVQDMFNEISNDLYSTPAINEELMTDLEKSFYTYTMSNFGPFNMSSVESRDLLDKLPARFTEFKKANKNKYLILDELQIRNDGKLKLIGLNNRKKSKDFETKFTDSWKDLLIENPQLAEDLIKYSFIVSGFRMNSTQFFTYIPHEYLLNEGINEFIKAFSRENKYDFIDKFYLNNTDKFKYVNKTFDNELFSEDFATGFIVREAGKSKYYLKRDTGDGIYKLEGYNKNNQAVYIRVNKLGYKAKGSNIVEYGDQFSKDTLELNKEYLHKLKNIVVTSRDKFKENFELDKIEDREEDVVDNDNKVIVHSEAYGTLSIDTNPNEVKTQQFIDLIQPQIQNQAYRENKSPTANDMFNFGLRWTRKTNAKKPVKIKSYGAIEGNEYYVYDSVDQNGNKLPELSKLQPIIDELQNSLGINMSDYDSVIGNIYLPGQGIATHRDTSESNSARNYPVIVYTIGNNNAINIYENEQKEGAVSFASDSKKSINTKNGTVYAFGVEGKGRFEVAHDTPKNIDKVKQFPPIKLPNGEVITNYTITLTFRRAQDLNENTPVSPKRENINTVSNETKQIDNNNKVVEGDIFSLEGIPVITTNLGGVHGAGLAQLAKSKGLITQYDGSFKATNKVVQLPVKKKWSDSMSMNDNMILLQNSLNSLSKTASENPNNTYLLPLAGLGHGEGSVEEILPILINTVKSNNNIKLVLPSENINLGRQGTVRKDSTRENLPKIKEILKQNGLILNETKQLSLFEETSELNLFEQADKMTPIEQNFSDGYGGRTMQPQFKGKSTMDLIISGDRTRTSRANTDIQRMVREYNLSKISDLTGKIVRMTDKSGRQVYTRITSVNKLTQEYQDTTWQKEGWSKEVTDKIVGQYPYAIEFEVVNKETKQPIVSEPITSMSELTNHSGGAYGADTFWDLIGREFGVTEHKHYRDAGNTSLSQKLRNNKVGATVLTSEQMEEARTQVEKLLGKKFPNTTQGNLQVRNYYQVANADAVYAIATLNDQENGVNGGTNIAVQLGIKLGKPVYVWDIETEGWAKYDTITKQFEPSKIPVLSKNFAGIGSRDIENYNILDKTDNKWKPRKEFLGEDKSNKAQQAVRDVYQKTKDSISSEIKTEIKSEVKLNYQEATKEFIQSLPEKGYTTEHGNFRIGLSDKTSKYAYDLQNQNINIDDIFNQSEPFYVLKRLALSADTRGNFERGARYYLIDTKNKGIFKISNKKELDINSLYKVNLQEHVKPYAEKESFNSKVERITFYQSLKDAVDNFKNPVEKNILENKPEVETKSINEVVKTELTPGQYVKYNNETYVVTKQNSNGTVQIYNPNISGSNGKISVAKDRLSIIDEKAKIVTYKGYEYLVTPRNTIISMVTNKLMNWTENDGNRKAILALSNNEILAPETVQVESSIIQSEVKTKAEPNVFKPANAQQENAITAIQDFIKNGDPSEIFILEGKAGTGKTTIVQEAIAEAVASGKRIQISALSHKAKLVLAQKLDKRFPKKTGSSSIAGLLGMTMNQETGEFEPGYGMERPIESADIIIVDEASMVNEEALQLIMQEKRKFAKVIFLGDRGQLPPIRKISSDEISLVFESENKASLTERVRQGEESPILPFADYFWDNSESSNSKLNPIPDGEIKDKLSDKGNLVFIKNLYDSFDDVVKVFKQGIDTGNFNVIKIVTYKNATRQEYNRRIRKEIFGEDVVQFVEKDQIMFQNNYSLDAKTSFSNSDEFNIVSIKEQEKNGYKVFQIGVNMDEGSSAITYFPVLNNEDKQKFNEDVSNLFEAAAKLPKGDLRKYAYQKAWSLKNMFAEIDYSYAITSHKSQGSTYDNVIVDLKDIYGVGATSAKSKSRSVYTAITRAKNTAILITSKAETNDSNVKQSLGIQESNEDVWNKHKESIIAKFPDFTLEQFNNMTLEERNKLIECI